MALLLVPVSLFATQVTFKVKGLRNSKGVVWVGVYDSQEGFLQRDKQVTDCSQLGEISDGSVDVVCELEPGRYGAAAFHDENVNKDLDRDFFGIPKEGFGFPNGVTVKFAPPDFDEVLFSVGEDDIELDINFQYIYGRN